jgi:hypothetical protein
MSEAAHSPTEEPAMVRDTHRWRWRGEELVSQVVIATDEEWAASPLSAEPGWSVARKNGQVRANLIQLPQSHGVVNSVIGACSLPKPRKRKSKEEMQ